MNETWNIQSEKQETEDSIRLRARQRKKERFLQIIHKENLIKQRMNVCQRVKKKNLKLLNYVKQRKVFCFFPKKYKDGNQGTKG